MGELSKLPNIGKTVEEQLIQVGINSADELKKTGAKAAWLKIQEIDESACIHRLMALEGAIQGESKNDAAGGCENGSERILSVEKEIEKSKKKKRSNILA